MVRLFSFLVIATTTLIVLADQPARGQSSTEADTSAWQKELEARLSGSQASYRNWAEGGVSTMAVGTSVQGAASNTAGRWEHQHETRLTIGYLKTGTARFRKSDDLLRWSSTLLYQGAGMFSLWQPALSGALRTQFAPGFDYSANPYGDGREPPVRISAFMAPGITTQSLGLQYDQISWLTQRFGIGGKQTWVRIRQYRPLYGLAPENAVRWEIGLESRTQVDLQLLESTRLQSSLDLFRSFGAGAELPDLIWENILSISANDWITTNLELVFLYDADIRKEIQIKEVLSVGISFALL